MQLLCKCINGTIKCFIKQNVNKKNAISDINMMPIFDRKVSQHIYFGGFHKKLGGCEC